MATHEERMRNLVLAIIKFAEDKDDWDLWKKATQKEYNYDDNWVIETAVECFPQYKEGILAIR